MGFALTDAAWKLGGLSPTLRLTLLATARRANGDNICWPSQRRIAADTGLSERAVRKALAELSARKVIIRSPRIGLHGRTSDLINLSPLLSASAAATSVREPASIRALGTNKTCQPRPDHPIQFDPASPWVPDLLVGDMPAPAPFAATTRNDVPPTPGTIRRETPSCEQSRENPSHARASTDDDAGPQELGEEPKCTPQPPMANLFCFAPMPVPGDPMTGVLDRISDLLIDVGQDIADVFDPAAPGLRSIGALAMLVARFPKADYRQELLWLAAMWRCRQNAPIRSWTVVAAILERRLSRQILPGARHEVRR